MPRPCKAQQVLIRSVHRGLTHSDIFQKLNDLNYLSLIDVSSGYQNLELDEIYHTSQHLHVSLADIDTKDCHLEQLPQEKSFSTRLMRY